MPIMGHTQASLCDRPSLPCPPPHPERGLPQPQRATPAPSPLQILSSFVLRLVFHLCSVLSGCMFTATGRAHPA